MSTATTLWQSVGRIHCLPGPSKPHIWTLRCCSHNLLIARCCSRDVLIAHHAPLEVRPLSHGRSAARGGAGQAVQTARTAPEPRAWQTGAVACGVSSTRAWQQAAPQSCRYMPYSRKIYRSHQTLIRKFHSTFKTALEGHRRETDSKPNRNPQELAQQNRRAGRTAKLGHWATAEA